MYGHLVHWRARPTSSGGHSGLSFPMRDSLDGGMLVR